MSDAVMSTRETRTGAESADQVVACLMREIARAKTYSDIETAWMAIERVRQFEKRFTAEAQDVRSAVK